MREIGLASVLKKNNVKSQSESLMNRIAWSDMHNAYTLHELRDDDRVGLVVIESVSA
jgi:hypothetical protein